MLSGSVNRGKNDPSQSLQMMERPLMTPDELKFMPKGEFIVMKTGAYPMKVKLKLFFKWGITFGEPYQVPEHGDRPVRYASRERLMQAIRKKYPPSNQDFPVEEAVPKEVVKTSRGGDSYAET